MTEHTEPEKSPNHRVGWRLLAATCVSTIALVAAILVPSYGGSDSSDRAGDWAGDQLDSPAGSTGLKSYADAARASIEGRVAELLGQETVYLPNGTHVHLKGASVKSGKVMIDPAEKNALSRSSARVGDSTTAAQAKVNRAAAARQRAQREPRLVKKRLSTPRRSRPENRYAMANGCYAVQNLRTERWLDTTGTPSFRGATRAAGTPLFFKPSDLGRYLLWSPAHTMLRANGGALATTPTPGPSAVWSATQVRRGVFKLTQGSISLYPVALRTTTRCSAFPEISVNVSGRPTGGVSSQQEVRGYIDAHTHGMAFEFLGGMVHCGRPWDAYGVTVALRDCVDHEATLGKGSVLEAFLSGDLDGHDPVGWPTFKDWPAPASLTHEGTYYKWIERSWRAGQRILVNLLVENNQLCELYPLKKNSCNDMDSIRLQAQDMRRLERYIDAQSGGPGKGWYRIVTNPDQARKVINAGKLAVVMGIETSVPFDCSQKLGIPQCTKAQLDRRLSEVRRMGVSQMELVNKFDNALSGVAGDEGTTGQLVNFANFKETGSYWRMRTCNPQDPEVHDKDQIALPSTPLAQQQDSLFGAVAKVGLGLGVNMPMTPVYPPAHHCNSMGLSDLGAYTIRGLAKRHMLFDPDHMSVRSRAAALDLIESMRYTGVLSSHSWSTVDAYPRILKDKGFIAPYAGDSAGFVAKWKRHLNWANPRTYWGFGFGADINGLGAQGNPRSNNKNPVRYPFKGLGGVIVGKQVSGQRVYDINKDGVSHYGLYPDWIEDLRKQAGSAIVKDLARGPEAYLQTWERAYGIRPNACTNGGKLRVGRFKKIRRGTTSWNVLRQVGQPNRRLGNSFTYCARGAAVKVTFNSRGRVTKVTRL